MSELPQQADALSPAEDGFDPARVELAFATFAERVRELESVAAELRAELHSLRAERTAPARFADEDWPVESGATGDGFPSSDWVATVPPPLARALTVPRLALEGAFLLLVAVLAGLADLDAGWIVLVMAVAWGLVALAEWAAAAKRSRWRLDEIAPAVAVPGPEAADSTGPWDMPVVESTAVEVQGAASESKTMVTKLPAGPGVEPTDDEPRDDEAGDDEPGVGEPATVSEATQEPSRRGFRLRRRRAAEPGTADPWEV